MKRTYSKIPIEILDDPAWARLSATEWKRNFLEFVFDPANMHTEIYVHPTRREFERMRQERVAELLERDRPACAKCGSTEILEIDHILPIAKGGTNDLNNLQFLCRHCNRSKKDKIE